ncbi:MAG TPA: hypothetical protein VF834_19680 [Streptosporangiaceae bacterium]
MNINVLVGAWMAIGYGALAQSERDARERQVNVAAAVVPQRGERSWGRDAGRC